MKKTMTLWDVVFMNVAAIVSLRNLPVAAQFGAASSVLWILAALFFFIPLGLVSSELAAAWPTQGGMYAWVRCAFGEKPAFLTAWFYWLNNLFFFPSVLTANAVAIAFLIDPALKDNKGYVCASVLVVFWLITIVNFKSMKTGKWLANASGLVGNMIPGFLLIVLGVLSAVFWKRAIPTDFSLPNWLPELAGGTNLPKFSMIMFAMAGIELSPTLAGETEDPQRTFPRATVISAMITAGIYILATTAMTLIISPAKIGSANGVMDATLMLADELKISYLVGSMALMSIVGNIGGLSVWLVCPIKMLFESTKEGIFPPFATRLNSAGMPRNALLIQALFLTAIVLPASLFPTVGSIYQALVLMATVTYFLPYLLMFAAFLKLRKAFPETPRPYKIPGGAWGAWAVTLIGSGSVILGIVLSFVPSEPIETRMAFFLNELGIGLGPLVFGFFGFLIYRRYEMNSRKETP